MQDPEFVSDLVQKVNNEVSPVPAPPRSTSKKKPFDPTKNAFFRSVVLHAFAIVSFLLYEVVGSRLGWDDQERLKALQAVKTAIRVDVVDLPRIKKSELQDVDLTKEVTKNPEEATEKKEDIPSPTAMVDATVKAPDVTKDLKKESEAKSSAQKLKELKDRLAADQKRRDQIAKLLKKKEEGSSGRQELAGNVKSEGYSTTGSVAGEADVYVGKARAHLQHHWRVPGWVNSTQHRARILVRLSPSGKVVFKKLTKASGSNDFDNSVSKAVENADPFPAPPETLRLQVLKDGIEFGFPE